MINLFIRIMSLVSTCAVVIVSGAVAARNADAASLKVAYAHVLGEGTLDTANSKNVVEMGGGNHKMRSRLSPMTPLLQAKV
jgi:hypothetical protein